MSIAALIRSMAEAGAPIEAIALAVEAIETSSSAARSQHVKQKGAERQARHRAKLHEESDGKQALRNDKVTKSDAVTSPPNDSISNPPEPSLRSDTVQARKARFAEFRSAYPKRIGANPWGPAEDKFLRLTRDGEDPETIIEGTRRYAASRAGEDGHFTCTALVFLNQRRWLDDHEPVKPFAAAQPRAGPIPPDQLRKPGLAAIQRRFATHS